jgi:hypothetical protein
MIEFGHDIQPGDYPITEQVFSEFKRFVISKPGFNVTAEQMDRSRSFIERQLRYDLITAAYGSVTALQVFNEEDPQIARAVAALPRARELALSARRTRARS